MARPVILLTRPEASSHKLARIWSDRFGNRVTFCIAPLMSISFEPKLPNLDGIKTLIFTSANGVAGYIGAGGPRNLPCYTVGDVTARAAKDAGLQAVSAGGDAGALIRLILRDGAQGPMLHLRGAHARGEIAERLSMQGCPVAQTIIYTQHDVPLNAEARALLDGTAPVLLPIFSPRSAILLGSGPMKAPTYVIAMSGTVASSVRFEFKHCIIAAHPDFESVTMALTKVLDAKPWESDTSRPV